MASSSSASSDESSDDYNAALDEITLAEGRVLKRSYSQGFAIGCTTGHPEAFHLGYHRGAELGRELGFYLGNITHYINKNKEAETTYSEKILNQLTKVKDLIEAFSPIMSEDFDVLEESDIIRSQYKKACSLLKISSEMPYDKKTEY